MNKNIVGAVIIVVIIAIGFYFFGLGASESGAKILTEDSTLIRYQINDSISDYAFLSYNFRKDSDGEWLAQGFVDANGDGEFSDDEWVIQNAPARVIKNFPNRFSVALPDSLKKNDAPESVAVSISLTESPLTSISGLSEVDGHKVEAAIETVPLVHEFGMDIPGASEELKRGIGATPVYAHEHTGGVNGDNLPDLSGGPMDCFALATANNLINMATQNGRRGDLPPDPQELVQGLKDAMQWDNGILNRNFLTGKAQIVEDLGLPIETEEILRPTIEQLRSALTSGDGVEISTAMVNSKSGQANTGHVFTGVSATNQTVSLHDPATPQGTDTLGTAMTSGKTPYTVIDYPMWDGIVVVDAIYIQRWKESETTQMEDTSTAVEDPETENSVGGGSSTGDAGAVVVEKAPEVEIAFAHVKPGEYSEIYIAVTGLTPGEEVNAKLFREGSANGTPQIVDADENGVAHFTFRITQYGNYKADVASPDHGYLGNPSIDVK